MSGSRKRHAIAQPYWEARRTELARQDRLMYDPQGRELLNQRNALFARFADTGEAPGLADLQELQSKIEKRLNELEVM